MSEKKIKVSIGRTIQTAPYESFRIDVSQEEVVDGNEEATRKKLFAETYNFVKEVEEKLRKVYQGGVWND